VINDDNRPRLFAPSEPVVAGGWRAELRGDELADISFRGIPVLRAVRAVVRDHDWRTLAPSVRSVEHHHDGDASKLVLGLDFAGFGSSYAGELAIVFTAGSLSVTFDGIAPVDFRSNRIGLVVLHRPDDAGRAVTIGSPCGGSAASRFPSEISPHQPFLDVASMEWERDGAGFRLAFSGDVFETEDQRNWTDASFKTYSTPLTMPFPVEVAAGDRVRQSLVLTATPGFARSRQPEPITEAVPAAVANRRAAVVTVLDDVIARVPALSVSATTGTTGGAGDLPAAVPGLDALLLELRPGPDAGTSVRRAMEQADVLGVPLDVRLQCAAASQIPGLLELLPLGRVSRLAVFHSGSHVTEPDLWLALKSESDRRGFAGTLLAGARSHFTELNRNAGSLPPDAPAVAFSITPQMHATEVAHMVDTLPMQRLAAQNAFRLGSGRPLHLGPVTLKARFNAVATSGEDGATAEAMATDPLQPESFAAAWMLGSIAALSIPGVGSVSYFEASGPRGISGPEGLTPAGELLAALAAVRGADVLAVEDGTSGLVLYPVRDAGTTVLFAANLTAGPLAATVRLPGRSETRLDLEPWTAGVHRIN
jgi:hypothetical protein